uniref:Uncharacterized protein LOC101510874 n=1 Tax=Cicer arietinum TaxID=3827 RepID=A0A1S2XQG8_CICAR|nr:uncharacterized protein LOC101510874 [Cicer arietinum]
MKLGSILLIVGAIFALFALTNGSDVAYPDIKFCPRVLQGLSGDCLNAQKDCYAEFNGRYKDAQARHCRCDTTSNNSHQCSCCIVCGLAQYLPSFSTNQLPVQC